jgi:serine/threonine-protein kinase HipA
MGSAQRWWLRRLNLPAGAGSDLEVMRQGTIAPIGNLRIAESVPRKSAPPRRFPRQSVVEREHAFLEYAADMGAQVGGATGAGGDSPKVLVRCERGGSVWIDVWQDEPESSAEAYLVKFARSKTERDRQILRSEGVYYKALAALGLDTVSVKGMSLEEGPSGPSLWLPRFDIDRREGGELRWGVESIYSLVGAAPGAYITHQRALEALREVVPAAEWVGVLLEYLKRDLLNLVFGNSDNHGRNMAVLKTDQVVRLAPIYDFAPMKMDLEGVTRTTRWESFESGGEVDWPGLLTSFGEDEGFLRAGLRDLARQLRRLPVLLKKLGLPRETLEFPSLGLAQTEEKLQKWTLL